MQFSVAPLRPLPAHHSPGSARIYKLGYSNRKRFEKQEQAYVLSRIINEQDYNRDRPLRSARDFYAPKSDNEAQTVQMTTLNSSRQSRHSRNRSHGASQQSHMESVLDDRRLRMSDLSNIKYIRYKVDPYIANIESPLRKYKKKKSIDNRYDFLKFDFKSPFSSK